MTISDGRPWAIIALLTALVAGCQAGSGSDPSTTPSAPNPDDAALQYAACMRENGVDMADPDSSGMIRVDAPRSRTPTG